MSVLYSPVSFIVKPEWPCRLDPPFVYMGTTTPDHEHQTANPFSMKYDRMKKRIKKFFLRLQC